MSGIVACVGPAVTADTIDLVRPLLVALARRGAGGADILVCDPVGSSAYVLDGPTGNRIHELPVVSMRVGGTSPVVLGACGESRQELPYSNSAFGLRDQECWVVTDCDLYNRADVVQQLETSGRLLSTGSDAELVAAAYRAWGTSFVRRLRGPFAAIVFDTRSGELLAFRDCFGMRPLYYGRIGTRTVFASEIPALLQLPQGTRRVAAQPLFDYLAYGKTDHDEATLFSDIHTVLPAHFVRVARDDPGILESSPHWKPPVAESLDISFSEATREVHRLVADSLAVQTGDCARVGTFLSGGIDSTALHMMLQDSAPGVQLNTFSYVGGHGARSEERWIDIVNGATNAKAHKLRLEPEDWISDIERVVESQGEPMGSIAVFAEDRLYGLAQEADVPVVLVGHVPYPPLDGSPALLGQRLASLVRRGSLFGALRHLWGTGAQRRATGVSFLSVLRTGFGWSLPAVLQRTLRPQFASRPWIDRRWVEANGLRPIERVLDGAEVIKSAIRSDLRNLVPRMLRFDDRNMVAHSVSGRMPFFDRALLEFILSLPEQHLVPPHGPRKAFAKAAMRDVLPAEILARNDKIGFAVPVQSWTTQVPEVASLLRLARDIPAVEESWIEAVTTRVRQGSNVSLRESFVVWRLTDLVRWARRFGVTF